MAWKIGRPGEFLQDKAMKQPLHPDAQGRDSVTAKRNYSEKEQTRRKATSLGVLATSREIVAPGFGMLLTEVSGDLSCREVH